VFNLLGDGNIARAVQGEKIGTMVAHGQGHARGQGESL
jgi:hypothetical protein